MLLVKHNQRRLLSEPYCPAALSCVKKKWGGELEVVGAGAVVVI